ncbi:MAG: chemotaxis protein CheB [Acetobacteraceae bacterium]
MAGNLRVVGIGASAGGIEALRGLFQHMPDPDGLAFVVVLHLSPDRTSMLAEVLQQWTTMPVWQATDEAPVAAGEVYVIPPNMLMTIEGGRLRVRPPRHHRARRTSRSTCSSPPLPPDQKDAAVGVVLSGYRHRWFAGTEGHQAGRWTVPGTGRRRARTAV